MAMVGTRFSQAADPFEGRLLPGERVQWSGHPGRGIVFSAADAILVPFSLAWCGFAIFWTVAASRGGLLFQLWGLMFVCIGLFFVFGRFFMDAWIRRGVAYALTDRRILISRSKPSSDFTAVALDRLPDARLKDGRGGRGTIRFGQPSGLFATRGFSTWSPSLDPTPQFIDIPDVRRVFDLVQQAASGR
jgi:hypothetical protein